jgi:ribose transport system permease protein
LATAIVACALMFAWQQILLPQPFSYFEMSMLLANAGPLAFGAMGLTIVFIVRGLDMSCGAVVALVNVLVASIPAQSTGAQIAIGLGAMVLGATVGAVNGYFIAVLRLQPVVVTLATMFILMGVNLLIMPTPGGTVPSGIVQSFTGDLVTDVIPAPLAIIAIGLVGWLLLRRSRFGTTLFAVGSSEPAAFANGINVTKTKFLAYVLAGALYGVGGLFLAAQTNTGDPLIGSGMLLHIFTATVLGGTSLNGGRGGCVGTVLGALTLMLTSSVLLTLDFSSPWTLIAEALILIIAVLGASLPHRSAFVEKLKAASGHLGSMIAARKGIRAPTAPRGQITTTWTPRPIPELGAPGLAHWLRRHREQIRLIVPAWILLVVVYGITVAMIGWSSISLNYFNSLLMLSVVLAVLGLGQGVVVMSGGLDLSVPSTLALCGVLLASLSNGSDIAALWAIPLVLAAGALIGLFNGLGVAVFSIPAIIITLASNGMLQGIALLYTGGFAVGAAPPMLIALFAERWFGLAPVVWLLLVFVAAAMWLVNVSVFGRRLVAVGSNARVARLSGVAVGRAIVLVYVLSGFCSALAGILLVGFSKVAFLSMGSSFQLPSIAAVLVGGTLVTGGRGHYLGILGGALLLVSVGTLVSGANLPVALRDVVFGLVMFGAVLGLRDRHAG